MTNRQVPAIRPGTPVASRGPYRFSRSSRVSGIALMVGLLAAWEIGARLGILSAITMPPVSAILQRLASELTQGELLGSLGKSVFRLAVGYLIATLVAVVLGTAMATYKTMFGLFEPLTELLRPIPVTALVPAAILFFGIKDPMKISMVVYASLWPILVNTFVGVRNVDPILVDTGRTFGVSRLKSLWHITLPAAAPFIAAGMRVGLAVALVVTVVAEMIAGGDGIGAYLLQTQRTLRVEEMWGGIFLLAVFGYFLNWLFLAIERRLLFWSSGYSGAR